MPRGQVAWYGAASLCDATSATVLSIVIAPRCLHMRGR